MKYAVKFFSQIENPENIPGTWPALVLNGQDNMIIPDGFTAMTEAEYIAYREIHQAEYDAWVNNDSRTKILTVAKIRDAIDDRTDELITEGLEYSGIRFKMDLEHQMSYKGAYDMRAYITYPYTIKGVGSSYLTFQNEGEYTNFILSCFGFLNEVIRGGWTLKDSLPTLTYAELITWTDPRN